MKTAFYALLATALLTACANTRMGIQKDSEKFSHRMQTISQELGQP